MSLLKRALVALAIVSLGGGHAWAVPAFARQTGMSCAQCHTQFPELTPFGRQFKLNAYVLGSKDKVVDTVANADGKDEDAETRLEIVSGVPLGAMIQAEMHWVRNDSAKDSTITATQGSDGLGYAGMPTQLSLFYAGEIAPKAGAFAQLTYDPGSGVMHIDNTDIRVADHFTVLKHDLVLGGTMNNNMGAQDVYNTMPAWGFPYAGPDGAPSPSVNPQVNGALAQNVAGVGAYADLDSWLYAEVSAYRSNPQNGFGGPYIQGWAPYWRVAAEYDHDKHSIELGTYGTTLALHPDTTGSQLVNPNSVSVNNVPADIYTDVAVDMQYQYIGDRNIVTVMASYIRENQALDYSGPGHTPLADNEYNNLDALHVSASYLLDRAWGATIAYAQTTGNNDATLYPGVFDPNGTAQGPVPVSPDSNSMTYEISYRPWLNTRLSLDYTAYGKFDGANVNYDGNGRSAADNNTMTLMAWLAY